MQPIDISLYLYSSFFHYGKNRNAQSDALLDRLFRMRSRLSLVMALTGQIITALQDMDSKTELLVRSSGKTFPRFA